MKPIHYMAIFVRLFSIFLFLYSLQQLSLIFEVVKFGNEQSLGAQALLPIFSIIPWFAVAVVTWFFPLTVAGKICPNYEKQGSSTITPESLLALSISALSLCFLYYAITDSAYWILSWHFIEQSRALGVPVENSAERLASIYTTGFELFFSVVILVNSKRLAARIHALR